MDAAGREPLRVALELLQALLHEADLVGLVVDREVRAIAEPRRLTAEDPAARGVERHHPAAARGRADEVRDALTHLGRGLVRERDREDLGGLHPDRVQQVRDPAREHASLPGAGACDHEERPLGRQHRLPLGLVQVLEVRRGARRGHSIEDSGAPTGPSPYAGAVRVALMIEGQEGVTWEQWCALAAACEEHGIDTLYRSDHYISMADEDANVAHDAWTTLAALAARTTTLRLGTLVSPVTFRQPALVANAAATVDHVSGGRVELGLGAGWMEREHRAFGFPFPEIGVRVEMFAEQLEIVHRLWTEDRVDFRGRHYTLESAPGLPKPVQRPRPPLLVGGGGRRGTAEPAARFADEYNSPFVSPADFADVRRRVREACERGGRDPETMRFSTMIGCLIGSTRAEALERARQLYERTHRDADFDADFDIWLDGYAQRSVVGSVDEVATRLREYEAAGCERVMLQHLLHADLEPVRLIGRELGPALV